MYKLCIFFLPGHFQNYICGKSLTQISHIIFHTHTHTYVCVCFFKFTGICKTFYYFFYINVIKLCSLLYLYHLSFLLLATEALTIQIVRTPLVNLYIA
jgi:hypothetical protein